MKRNIIKEIMNTHKISASELSRQVGYDKAMISRVSNRSQKMSYRLAYRISECFTDYTLAEIIESEGIER